MWPTVKIRFVFTLSISPCMFKKISLDFYPRSNIMSSLSNLIGLNFSK